MISTKQIGSWIRASNYFQGLNFLIPKIPIRKWFNLTGNEYLKFVLGFDTEIYISAFPLFLFTEYWMSLLLFANSYRELVTFCRVKILNKNWSCSVAWDCKICLFWYNGPMIEFNYFLWFLFHPFNELSPPRYQWRGSVRLSIPNHGFRLQVPCNKTLSFGSIQLLTGFPFSSKTPVPSSTWISTLKSSLLKIKATRTDCKRPQSTQGVTLRSLEPFQDVWFKSNSSLTETKIFGDSRF